MEKALSPLQRLLIWLIAGYSKLISPLLGNNCRFHPSCSAYAKQAVQTHGTLIGCWLTCKRIIKCNPLHPGGFDPVPNHKHKQK